MFSLNQTGQPSVWNDISSHSLSLINSLTQRLSGGADQSGASLLASLPAASGAQVDSSSPQPWKIGMSTYSILLEYTSIVVLRWVDLQVHLQLRKVGPHYLQRLYSLLLEHQEDVSTMKELDCGPILQVGSCVKLNGRV